MDRYADGIMSKLIYISLAFNLLLIIAGLVAINFLGGWKFVWYKMQHRGLAAEYEHRQEHLASMQLNKGDIIFLGNSITAYCEWAELLANPRIKNRGIPGDATDGVLGRLDPIMAAEPSQIFLMIGINDLLFHPRTRVVENYKKIVQKIRAQGPTTTLYLQSILPVNNQLRNSRISNEDILWINRAIKAIADRNKLTYIDLHTVLQDEAGRLDAQYSSDGVHLNGAAYQRWKTEIEDLIK